MTSETEAAQPPRRIRVKNDPRVMGYVFDVDPPEAGGWIYWFGDDRACHVSQPDYVEEVRS